MVDHPGEKAPSTTRRRNRRPILSNNHLRTRLQLEAIGQELSEKENVLSYFNPLRPCDV